MKCNLRMVAAQRDLWRPTEVLAAFQQVGFNPSPSKVAALWSGKPVTVRLDDLDKMCAALNCSVADLLQAEPLASAEIAQESGQRAVGAEEQAPGTGAPSSARSEGKRAAVAAAELRRRWQRSGAAPAAVSCA